MAIKGFAMITRQGYDPQKGKHVKDPHLVGGTPTLGACMPNIREQVFPGDHIFLISGKVPNAPQYVVGCMEVAEKINALAAYKRFPENRLRLRQDGQLTGNIIVDARDKQHPLDTHSSFARRIENYIVGCDPVVLTEPDEIASGREETLGILQSILGKTGLTPIELISRFGTKLDYKQVQELRDWLIAIKERRKAS
jgi:hypothetical protein